MLMIVVDWTNTLRREGGSVKGLKQCDKEVVDGLKPNCERQEGLITLRRAMKYSKFRKERWESWTNSLN